MLLPATLTEAGGLRRGSVARVGLGLLLLLLLLEA